MVKEPLKKVYQSCSQKQGNQVRNMFKKKQHETEQGRMLQGSNDVRNDVCNKYQGNIQELMQKIKTKYVITYVNTVQRYSLQTMHGSKHRIEQESMEKSRSQIGHKVCKRICMEVVSRVRVKSSKELCK